MTIAYNETPATDRDRPAFFGVIGGLFGLLGRSIAAANTYETLSHLSDAQLARRGLTRPDIANVAVTILLERD